MMRWLNLFFLLLFVQVSFGQSDTMALPEHVNLAKLKAEKDVIDYFQLLPLSEIGGPLFSSPIEEQFIPVPDSKQNRDKLLITENMTLQYLELEGGLYDEEEALRPYYQIVLLKDPDSAIEYVLVSKTDCRFVENCGTDLEVYRFDLEAKVCIKVTSVVLPDYEELEAAVLISPYFSKVTRFGCMDGLLYELPKSGGKLRVSINCMIREELQCEQISETSSICLEPSVWMVLKGDRFVLE